MKANTGNWNRTYGGNRNSHNDTTIKISLCVSMPIPKPKDTAYHATATQINKQYSTPPCSPQQQARHQHWTCSHLRSAELQSKKACKPTPCPQNPKRYQSIGGRKAWTRRSRRSPRPQSKKTTRPQYQCPFNKRHLSFKP